MAVNGRSGPDHSSSPSRSTSPSSGHSAQALASLRVSIDSDRISSPPPHSNGMNGFSNVSAREQNDDLDADLDPVAKLRRELEVTREEKETLETQYRNLLGKLTTMRTTLGNKLKQDAEELDRREQLVQQLTAQNDDLTSTVETLKEELIASNREAERASVELHNIRNRAFQESAQENLIRERELRETQAELERCRLERDEWERIAQQERVVADEAKTTIEAFRRDLEVEREAREREAFELESEREKSSNLQSVLEDFQSAKDHELQQAVKEYDTQLIQVTQSLAEYKYRALTAELQLEESHNHSSRAQELEKEVKEKVLLINKLRHEAVIMNEHLMEALRRLRRNSSDTNVDRRLVTNVLLSFLTTPRADAKRFEMLSLLATVLSWTDTEREKAGLQKAHTPLVPSSSFWSRSSASPTKKSPELEKTDETESFSRLWVEFLLTEAAAGESPTRSNTSLPGSPTISPRTPSFSAFSPGPPRTSRLASFSTAAMASSPNLSLGAPPSRKGKEKEISP